MISKGFSSKCQDFYEPTVDHPVSCRILQNAEIIRKLQKASFQTLFLSTESLGQESNYFGQFLGPSDTEANFDGDKLISFQNGRSIFPYNNTLYTLVHEIIGFL